MVSRLSGMLAGIVLSSMCALASLPAAYAQAAPQAADAPVANVPADIKKAFATNFPGIEIGEIRATPFAGLYEVQVGMDVLYTNAKVEYLLQGSLIDVKTRADLTAVRVAQLAEVPFSSLPLDLAIKQVRGNGARKMVVFEDPNCGYCKRLHQTLAQLDNITVYTLLFPILSPDSDIKARNIWCAKDRAATWREWMLNGKVPAEAQCETPIEEIKALGQKLMVRGTPAIFFADNSRVNGALPLDQLKVKVDSLK